MLGTILDAAGYIFVMIFAVTIFKEKISVLKLLALFLIISRIVVYALGG